MGHAIAILISSKILKYDKPLNLQIIICGLHGITLSDLYYEFNNVDGEDTFKQNLIRFNAISGLVFDLVFYLILILKILKPLAIKYGATNPVLNTIYILTFFLVVFTIAVLISSSDKEYFLKPYSFTYNGIFKLKRKLYFDYPILFTLGSIIIGYSLPCLIEGLYNISKPFIEFIISILLN